MDLIGFYRVCRVLYSLRWFYYGFTMVLLWFTMLYHGFVSLYNAFTMVLLWFYKDDHGMNLGYGWIYHLE